MPVEIPRPGGPIRATGWVFSVPLSARWAIHNVVMDVAIVVLVQLVVLVVLAVLVWLRTGNTTAAEVVQPLQAELRRVRDEGAAQVGGLRKDIADERARSDQGRELRFKNFEDAIAARVKELREEQSKLVSTTQQGLELTVSKSAQQSNELRQAVTSELKSIQTSNEKRLDEMRVLVQEKLDAILEKRLGAFGKSVSDMRDMLNAELAEQRKSSEAKLQLVVEGETKLREAISKDLKELRADNEGQIARMRDGVSKSITELQTSNEKKLEKMREVVE